MGEPNGSKHAIPIGFPCVNKLWEKLLKEASLVGRNSILVHVQLRVLINKYDQDPEAQCCFGSLNNQAVNHHSRGLSSDTADFQLKRFLRASVVRLMCAE